MQFKQLESSTWTVEVVYYAADAAKASVERTVSAATAEGAQRSVLQKYGIPWHTVVSIHTHKV